MIFIFISSDIIYSMTMVAPADGGRYRYCAPCPQVGGLAWMWRLATRSPTRGRMLAAFTAACLQTHLVSRQEKRVIIMMTMVHP